MLMYHVIDSSYGTGKSGRAEGPSRSDRVGERPTPRS